MSRIIVFFASLVSVVVLVVLVGMCTAVGGCCHCEPQGSLPHPPSDPNLLFEGYLVK